MPKLLASLIFLLFAFFVLASINTQAQTYLGGTNVGTSSSGQVLINSGGAVGGIPNGTGYLQNTGSGSYSWATSTGGVAWGAITGGNPLAQTDAAFAWGVASFYTWVDKNRTDSYTANGTIQRPYKTLAAAITAMSGPTTVVLVPSTTAYTASGTVPNYPLTLYGNNTATTVTSLTFQNSYTAYDVVDTVSGTITFNGGSSAVYRFVGGTLAGNVTLTSGSLTVKDRSMLGGTVTVNGGTLQSYYTVWTSLLNQTAGIVILDKCNWNTGKSGYLLTSSGGQISATNTTVTNTSTGGGISANNGATALAPNAMMNVVVTTLSGTAYTGGSSVTLWAKNTLSTGGVAVTPVATGLVAANSDLSSVNIIAVSSATSLSPWQAYNSIVEVMAAATVTLPPVASSAGANLLVYTYGAYAVKVAPNASEVIVLNGTALTGGYVLTNTSTGGDMVALFCDGTSWYVVGTSTWTGAAT